MHYMYNPASLVLYDAKLPIYKYGINCKLAVSIRSSLGCSEVRFQLSSATYVRCPTVETTPQRVGVANGYLDQIYRKYDDLL